MGSEKITVVSSKYVESRVLTLYEPLPINNEGDMSLWKQRAELYIEDLEWLTTKLPQYKFWSQMVYDPNCIKCVFSFLQNAIPVYLDTEMESLDPSIREMYYQIKTLIFTVFRKLTFCQLSKEDCMSPEYLADLLYKHNLLTLPNLLDFCALYAHQYPDYTSSILDTMFKIQPYYLVSLEMFVEEIVENCFDLLEDIFDCKPTLVFSDDEEEPRVLSSSSSTKKSSKISAKALTEYSLFLLDSAFALSAFVECYPPAADMFHKNCLEDRISKFYENTVQSMDSYVKRVLSKNQMPIQNLSVKNSLKLARYYLLHLYKSCLSSCISSVLSFEELSREELKICVDSYMNTLSDGIAHNIFIADYHTLFPLHNDLDLLQQAAPHLVDSAKIDYILEVVTMCCNSKQEKSPAEEGSDDEDWSQPSSSNNPLSEDEIKGKIAQIKEMFPNLGEGFIQSCLQYYKNDLEMTLMNILQNSLPSALANLDRDLPYIPPEPEIYQKLPNARSSVVDSLAQNIQDIHIGKRDDGHNDMKSLLDDKSYRHDLKEFYAKAGVEDWGHIGEYCYDDEYDDSYDGPQELVPVDLACDDDPSQRRREFVVPRCLRQPEPRQQQQSESESEEDDPSRPKPLDFCQNPEAMRARAEQRRQSRQQMRGGNRPPPSRDVQGNAKGQGQSKEVLLNRSRKNQNKSARGNHNRRDMAGRKRNQGMIPS